MEENKLGQAGWRPKFQSEFSMGDLDFHRYNDHLKFVEEWCGAINSTDIPDLDMIQKYFSGLATLYKLWRPIISVATKKKTLDEAIKKAREMKRKWENAVKNNNPFSSKLKLDLADSLDEIHTELMEIKQVIGLGIVVKRNLTANERIKSGIRGNKDYSNLPEA